MALRVLLADESSTIKKVIQLALQDFSVEVKSVPVGLDVLSIAQTFKPHLIFVDVLLAKKSGYEVCKELKQNPNTMAIPTVLMWSGFMDLDEAKFAEAKANGKLEKPFDSDALRSLVKNLVPFTMENQISDFLIMPKLPAFEEKATEIAAPSTTQHNSSPATELKLDIPILNVSSESGGFDSLETEFNPPAASEPPQEVNMEDELPIEFEEFQQVSLHSQKNSTTSASATTASSPEGWSEANLSKFIIPDVDGSKAQVQSSGNFEEITFSQATLQNPKSNKATGPTLSLSHTEQVIREEARAIIEDICWKIMPGIVERVVREEINKLLSETEESI